MPFTGIDNIVTGYLGFGAVKFFGYSLYGFYIAHKYEREPMPVRFDSEGHIAQDLACKLCGYNLRTLSDTSKCPECGGSVAASVNLNARREPEDIRKNPYFVGLARTIIGLAFGTLYWRLIGMTAGPIVYFGLLPIRIIEWWLLLILLFDPKLKETARGWNVVGFGVLVSYVLDIPAMLGFCITGGVGIC